jgi:rhodanese-related sulfurtransferase
MRGAADRSGRPGRRLACAATVSRSFPAAVPALDAVDRVVVGTEDEQLAYVVGASLGRVRPGDASSAPSAEGPTTAAIDRLLAQARVGLDRVDARELAAEIEAGALVVDTRPAEQRLRDGALPGAVVVDRNVLEWRLDPTSPHRLPEADDPRRRIVVVCNEGFSSSLAAATLRRLGCARATDLVDGFQGWLRAGGQPEPPAS